MLPDLRLIQLQVWDSRQIRFLRAINVVVCFFSFMLQLDHWYRVEGVSDVYGIVLEGGGARGAYQVGAWQALRELGLEYGGVAGTSVGALNGAMMIQGDLDRALEIWSDIRPSRILGIDEALYERLKRREISSGDASSLLQRFKIVFRDGMDTAPLRLLLGGAIDEARVRAAGLEFGFVTVSLSTWSPLKMYIDDVPPGQLIDYLLASARLPGFKRQQHRRQVGPGRRILRQSADRPPGGPGFYPDHRGQAGWLQPHQVAGKEGCRGDLYQAQREPGRDAGFFPGAGRPKTSSWAILTPSKFSRATRAASTASR